MSERASIIENGVEGCYQASGDWIDQATADLINNGFGEG